MSVDPPTGSCVRSAPNRSPERSDVPPRGDNPAKDRHFEGIYCRGWPLAWSAARALLDCDADADGVAQRVLMRLLRAGPPAWHRDLADEFFLAAGRKEALTMRRDRRKHVALSEGFGGVLLSAESLPDYHAEQCELRALLERSIAGLPTRCREVLLRIGTGRVTRAEVAEELGISLGAVEKQITRGYRLLRQTLPPEIAEPF